MAAPSHDQDTATEVDYAVGSMEIGEQRKTFDFFIDLMKWGSLVVAVLLVLLTMMTSTGAGFIGSVVAAGVLLVLGVVLLKGKNDGETH